MFQFHSTFCKVYSLSKSWCKVLRFKPANCFTNTALSRKNRELSAGFILLRNKFFPIFTAKILFFYLNCAAEGHQIQRCRDASNLRGDILCLADVDFMTNLLN